MTGAELIAAERARQQSEEGYDAAHDEGHDDELAVAAACYALNPDDRRITGDVGVGLDVRVDLIAALWPWARRYWKPTPNDRIRELVKAGALIAAAIDSLQAGEP